MLFNSYEFIFIFLPVTFFVYFYLNKKKLTELAKAWLFLSSLFFYSWWNINYLPIILGSILFNYFVGLSLNLSSGAEKICSVFNRRSILIFGIILNLSLLGYFKYVDFFIENINFAFNQQSSLLRLALPLGISFFTFQQIAYLVDSFRQKSKSYNFLNYAVFVTFFPQLIAGPIVRFGEMIPQYTNVRNKFFNYKNISVGLFVFSIGLFKKVILADTFSKWATNGFDTGRMLNLFEAWTTSLSYTFQLYFDFSGYADMAIGLALLFNIKLPSNFNSPYKALNIQDFWRRWHMTLSRFLKDYVYIPLGGNRGNVFRSYSNLLATFIVGGIWHGAGWTFVFWGFLHGIAIVINRIWRLTSIKLPVIVAWFITFNFVNIAWIFFRAKELSDAFKILASMFSLDYVVLPRLFKSSLYFLTDYGVGFGAFLAVIEGGYSVAYWFFFGFIMLFCFKNTMQLGVFSKLDARKMLVSGGAFILGIVSLYQVTEFLYFNF
jgi:alginate O-acetyltransferase complex protein AlgI